MAPCRPVQRKSQRGREVVRMRPIDDHRDHRPVRVTEAEEPHLLADRRSPGRDRRADDDQHGRGIERGDGRLGQRRAAGEITAIEEDRLEACRHRPEPGLAPARLLGDREGLEPVVQPPRPTLVGMRIGEERAVFDRKRFRHGHPLIGSNSLTLDTPRTSRQTSVGGCKVRFESTLTRFGSTLEALWKHFRAPWRHPGSAKKRAKPPHPLALP